MGFMDELKKLTQPYDDEDEIFEGEEETAQPKPGTEQTDFENTFAAKSPVRPQPAKKPTQQGRTLFGSRQQGQPAQPQEGESLFGNFSKNKQSSPRRSMNFSGGKDAQVILFSPKTFDEAGEIVGHIQENHSVVMTLEGVPTDMARRLLDFISGIAFALGGKITPVSAKTFFITPRNVDIVGAQSEQPESDGQYF